MQWPSVVVALTGTLVCASCARDAASPIAAVSFVTPAQVASSANATAPDAGVAISVRDLLDRRATLVGTTVTVDVFETLWDADHNSAVHRGEYMVEGMARPLRLAGDDWDLARPSRHARPLPRGLHPPLRVVGQVFADPLTADSSWPETVIRVQNTTPIALPAAEHVASTADIVRDPLRWEGHYVEVDGVWFTGFETTSLDDHVWLQETSYATRTGSPADAGTPPPRRAGNRVRVAGFVHTRDGHFGHLGQYPAEILCTRIAFLGAP
jgi:hypothetical protein